MRNQSKNRISITIMPHLNELLDEHSTQTGLSKSSLIEEAVLQYFKKKLSEEAEIIAKTKFDDLPTEDEWLLISPLWD